MFEAATPVPVAGAATGLDTRRSHW